MGDTISLEPHRHDAQAAVAPRHSCSCNHPPPAPAGDQQIDPVCGMAVTASIEKLRDHFDGNDYFFCGPRCLDKFRAAGREESDTDVDAPVTEREDPPVAGNDVALGVTDVEVRVDPRFVVPIARVVPA